MGIGGAGKKRQWIFPAQCKEKNVQKRIEFINTNQMQEQSITALDIFFPETGELFFLPETPEVPQEEVLNDSLRLAIRK
jgi:hypothetical protein